MASRQQTTPNRGTVARDRITKRVGEVMGCEGGRIQLRPLGGGVEWDVRHEDLEVIDQAEALSARLAATNARSRAGRGAETP